MRVLCILGTNVLLIRIAVQVNIRISSCYTFIGVIDISVAGANTVGSVRARPRTQYTSPRNVHFYRMVHGTDSDMCYSSSNYSSSTPCKHARGRFACVSFPQPLGTRRLPTSPVFDSWVYISTERTSGELAAAATEASLVC